MTFLEICQMVLDEGDQIGSDMKTTKLTPDMDEQHRKVVIWVKRAYRTIQRKNQFWKFLHNTGVFITTKDDGTKEYRKSGVREVIRDSIRVRVAATQSDWRLRYLTYKEWRDLFAITSEDIADGSPIWFIELPNGDYKIEPGPNAVYEITCDWYSKLSEFENDKDEPLWGSDLHEIIVWEALKDYALEYESSETLGVRVTNTLPNLWLQMYREYTPEWEVSGEFA